MKTFKKNLAEYLFLFWLGGSVYIEVELLYRGYTHWSMFVLAGFVFITVGWSNEHIFDWQDKFFKQVGLAPAILLRLVDERQKLVIHLFPLAEKETVHKISHGLRV